jgi:RNA polymerase sigma factor (sigma-70 family)
VRRKTTGQDSWPNRKKPQGEAVEWVCDSTTEILGRAQAGDRAAGQALIERALPALRRWSHGRIPKYGRGPADTDDIVQDAVLQALKRIETFEHRTVGALQAYLRTTVVNRIRDVVRRVRRRGVPSELPDALPDAAHTPLEEAIMSEQLDRFVEALQHLRPVDRQVIVWRIELGYSFEEIAQRLGKSTAATRVVVSRAMARLAKELRIESASHPSGQ